MTIKKTLGGDRLGAGKQMKVNLHNYERSTHDLGYIWRSTMAVGTLVPFMVQVGLPGDSFDIDMGADVKTYPTLGPLFGSFKLQLDIFQCPIRLYQGQLHNNKLGIGMKMSTIKLPQYQIVSQALDSARPANWNYDTGYINPSSLLAYLGNRGIGWIEKSSTVDFNAVPLLGYWDIYKNYYANKQEEVGYYVTGSPVLWQELKYWKGATAKGTFTPNNEPMFWIDADKAQIEFTNILSKEEAEDILWEVQGWDGFIYWISTKLLFGETVEVDEYTWAYQERTPYMPDLKFRNFRMGKEGTVIQLEKFDLDNLDEMRENILQNVKSTAPFVIDNTTKAPYGKQFLPIGNGNTKTIRASQIQEGLGIKTHQSDKFNNWLSTEWIDGPNGISAITAIDTTSGEFSLDTLNLAEKVYAMLNRIAVSGGSYDDWMEAVWAHQAYKRAESPIYHGGLSKEVVFQEVVSTAEAGDTNPLGSLAGKGGLAGKHKGGQVTIKIDEPSIILGIVSLTPRVDYSQGNEWHVNLKTMDDFHKPALDQIGFQELITEQMNHMDVIRDGTGVNTYRSAGKQPAWLDYMTNYNKTYGNFADREKEMYMTLNRRYIFNRTTKQIRDLTTYIDPSKYNYLFAHTELSAQNFWVQIACDITARRKMSAKIMPNL